MTDHYERTHFDGDQDDLGRGETRAERLARELEVSKLEGIPRALAEEMVLTVERMERLDKVLQGDVDAWIGVLDRMPPGYAEVVINAPLAEVRQQGAAFKGLAVEFAKLTGQEVTKSAPSKADELAQRRQERRAGNA